jgi:GH15 family glucan-1,4-alpha-glucosidase
MPDSGYAPDVEISDYALLSDCHGAALVAPDGAIEWCCLPRFDAGALFARMLDPDGGACTVQVVDGEAAARRYLDDTMVLETQLHGAAGEARLLDFMPFDDRALVRIVEGLRGTLSVRFRVAPRFDYGEVTPWLRHHGRGLYAAIGGDDGLLCACEPGFEPDDGELIAELSVREGERARLLLAFRRPEDLEDPMPAPDLARLDDALEDTVARWRDWSSGSPEGTRRSAIVLKALTYTPTGAMVAAVTTSLPEARSVDRRGSAAVTTSLPEAPKGRERRTWDYRYTWIRDAVLATHCLTELGHDEEANAFRRFIERSAAGRADDLHVFYGVGGERRLAELELDHLRGWDGAQPVRVGNAASSQLQLDAYGHLVQQSFNWAQLGHPPDDDYWRFLLQLVDAAAERWNEPDRGIWEWRGEPRHFVHSKVLCWVALDRGLAMAESSLRKAPERRWKAARDEVREAVLDKGYDAKRGTFVQAFGDSALDAAVLRLPAYGFLPYDDERMVSTVEVLRFELDDHGLIRRYNANDGMPREGAFIACTFWLAQCLAGQGKADEAQEAFDRALRTASELGLFSEEADGETGQALGNFPQAFTHLAHIEAALTLKDRGSKWSSP